MKKGLVIFTLLLFLFGCQQNINKTFDPSNLNMIQAEWSNDKITYIKYAAPSVKEGLKALPFDTDGFKPAKIDDLHNDGEFLIVDHSAYSKDLMNNAHSLIITAYNFTPPQLEEIKIFDEIQLNNGIVAKSNSSGSLFFQIDEITYYISMIPSKDIKELIHIANQMID